MKLTLLLSALLCSTLLAIPDDGNPATIRARFSWTQPVANPVITKYKVTIWKVAETPEQGRVVEVSTAPQVGVDVPGQVIEDGLVQGETYRCHVKAASALDESDPSSIVEFRVGVIIPSPSLPKVEIQVSFDLNTWKTVALVPLTEDNKFVRARIAGN